MGNSIPRIRIHVCIHDPILYSPRRFLSSRRPHDSHDSNHPYLRIRLPRKVRRLLCTARNDDFSRPLPLHRRSPKEPVETKVLCASPLLTLHRQSTALRPPQKSSSEPSFLIYRLVETVEG